ncbi:DUF2254 domain-containing protein [Deinococcus humi]|uniref:Putative membrane protein n=1 Tax=Deinococcus humi TaxID=662880 RepID=A0A7W8JW88_9DEIO|nr:DUF2254 domain-containing protein [Deinococcus humi]MBB5362814.1 putative membrane protein [Deinococcus humi]GGO26136.1 hypothetical protein GCM10008949_16640 [Deinococcus humi]
MGSHIYSRLWTRLTDALHSLWFLPGVMLILGIGLAEGTLLLDEHFQGRFRGTLLFFPGGGDGARALLGGIATSVLAVTGTVFSVTITALSIATTQMGPRLLESFTRDVHNSLSLGVFLATVSHAFMVLRGVRTPDNGPAFVPHLAIMVALVLTFLSLCVLIYFIHHVAASINVGHVIRLVHDDLCRTLLAQTTPGEGQDQPAVTPPRWTLQETVGAPRSGYLQSLDVEELTRLAQKNEAVIRLLVRPGDFVMKGTPIALVTPQAFAGIDATLTIGHNRTTNQDIEYAARKLVEVAARALSPALNDPNTAIAVLDHLGDALCLLQNRSLPNGQYECNGQLRLMVPLPHFPGLVEVAFNLIRQYGKNHPAVMIHMLEVLTRAAACLPDPVRREVLRQHAALAHQEGLQQTKTQHDQEAIERRYQRFLNLIEEMQSSQTCSPRAIEYHE